LRKLRIVSFCLLPACLLWVSCGSGPNSSTSTTGIKYRAFVSNYVTGGTASAGLYIVNAFTDVHPNGAPIAAGNSPGMMVLTPNLNQTLVFSGNNTQFSDNQFSIINNASESNAAHVTLAGYTESFLVSPDSSTAYVAVPTAQVIGQNPGEIEIVGLNGGTVNGTVNIPSVHYLALSNAGDRLLAFSDTLSSLAPPCTNLTPSYLFIVTPSQVGISSCPITPVPGVVHPFDHPVSAFFASDDSIAYIINCGPECGGTQASVQTLEMTPSQCLPDGACAPTPVPAATVGLQQGSLLYLAGTPYSNGSPSQPCTGQTTAATTCGVVTLFDLSTMQVVAPPVPPPYCQGGGQCPITITDGYHNRIAMGSYGQLYVGARTCTEIIAPVPPPPGAEVRGCLSIYNTLNSSVGTVPAGGVFIPPQNGDATGIQPITSRTVVYVVEGGTLNIYDDTFDALYYNQNDPNNPGQVFNLLGYFMDVKLVNF
jgi:hypothetical protein